MRAWTYMHASLDVYKRDARGHVACVAWVAAIPPRTVVVSGV